MDHPAPNPVPSPGIIHHTKLGKPALRWDPTVFEQVFLTASPGEGRWTTSTHMCGSGWCALDWDPTTKRSLFWNNQETHGWQTQKTHGKDKKNSLIKIACPFSRLSLCFEQCVLQSGSMGVTHWAVASHSWCYCWALLLVLNHRSCFCTTLW